MADLSFSMPCEVHGKVCPIEQQGGCSVHDFGQWAGLLDQYWKEDAPALLAVGRPFGPVREGLL